MRNLVIAALSAGLLTVAAGAAGAMPLSSAPGATDSGIQLVAGGCGPGFRPGRFGGCRPFGGFGGGPRFAPRVVVRPGYGYGRPGPRYGRPGYGYGRPAFRAY